MKYNENSNLSHVPNHFYIDWYEKEEDKLSHFERCSFYYLWERKVTKERAKIFSLSGLWDSRETTSRKFLRVVEIL